jgi:hypothetical protein
MKNQLLLRCFYPATQTIINNKSLVYSFYTNQFFKRTKLLVSESRELKHHEIIQPILSVINLIEIYPDEFLPSEFDRFVFIKNEKQIFSMINMESSQEGRTTLIDYQTISNSFS